MKFALPFCILLIASALCKAQYIPVQPKPIYETVSQDTINITGEVYDALGHPVADLLLISKNQHFIYKGYHPYGKSDKRGAFMIKGAYPQDTLSIYWNDKVIPYKNSGSRYFQIHLPPVEQSEAQKASAIITAKRIREKKIPKFNIITNSILLDFYGIAYDVWVPAYFSQDGIKFNDYVNSKITYPKKAIEANIEGIVEVGFTVQPDGSLHNCKLIRGIGYGCDGAVLKAVEHSPKWRPARFNGRTVISQSSVIINFQLTHK
jgi:TonB family protein